MATRVIVQSICDICNTEGVDTTTPISITINKVDFEVDLCKVCFGASSLLGASRPVKRPYTKKAKEPMPERRSKPDLACGWKGCDYVAPRLQSLGAHRTKRGHR